MIRTIKRSSNSLYSNKVYTVERKIISTPGIAIKDTWASHIHNTIGLDNYKRKFVLELFLRIDRGNISRLEAFLKKKRAQSTRLYQLSQKLNSPMITIIGISNNILIDLDTYTIRYITESIKEMHTDIISLPYIEYISKKYSMLKDHYWRILNQFINRLTQHDIKIAGILQKIDLSEIEKLLNMYLELGIDFLVLDFGASTPYSSKEYIREILTYLTDTNNLEKTILYGININKGRRSKDADKFRARDIVAFGYGIDIIGGKRINAVPAQRPQQPYPTLFNRATYCYYIDKQNRMEKRERSKYENLMNIKEILEEVRELENYIHINRVIEYISNKECIDKRDIKAITKYETVILEKDYKSIIDYL